jgi:hypothetical protein
MTLFPAAVEDSRMIEACLLAVSATYEIGLMRTLDVGPFETSDSVVVYTECEYTFAHRGVQITSISTHHVESGSKRWPSAIWK